MFQWKMHKYKDEAHARTYQIYFSDKSSTKWYLDLSLYYGEAASLVELLADSEVRNAVSEYMDDVPSSGGDFSGYQKAFGIVSPALERICTQHKIKWYESSVNIETIKQALSLERTAERTAE